ncbi:MerR family DNA-binding transcriptional regulator [Acrocarpospora phusangensis]|uniref:MerR family DNA-binding transcriptional regulator n=1 Tax=Acrocarpospora phusangensis TaxID=1070424 RepID=UPI001EF2670D|nr:MerR family DNA-binding transcriptional regulator [Acrocarpospora phusangensis]
MDGGTLYTIGALARRTGLTVKTIRFYSDAGIVPPTGRSPAGYRLYDLHALARLTSSVHCVTWASTSPSSVRCWTGRSRRPRSRRRMPTLWTCRSALCSCVARSCER